MLDVSRKENRGKIEEEMRKTERDNIKIQLHLTTAKKLSFDIHREMSVWHSLNKDNLSQSIHVWLDAGHAPNKQRMNFLQPCQHRVTVG